MPKIKKILLVLSSFSALFLVSLPSVVSAASLPPLPSSSGQSSQINNANLPSPSQTTTQLKNNPIIRDLNDLVTFGGGLVGIAVVGNIIFGGIQYTMAGGNPQATANARKRIANSLTAFVAFILIWAFLEWLVPGGVFG